ncbi:MAG: peptidoglycan editing factor PgeF [Paracoccaceae bacterium]|nr:peptidoglycan editing factor PgeF [Paracoccaceae bacterium]
MTLAKIQSSLIKNFKHGFFTRNGGDSSGIYKGLNCGMGSGDEKKNVLSNRNRVALHMGTCLENIVSVHQIHSIETIICNKKFEALPKADALVTNTPGLLLSVLTADCQPVIFADKKNSVIGIAHAGWRGALNGVLTSTINKMEVLGAERKQISAVIGPCISQAAYEVDLDFFEKFTNPNKKNRSFFYYNSDTKKYHFDLPNFSLKLLKEANILSAEWTGHCTYNDPKRFFSYRRSCHKNEPDYGRLISTIML